MTSLADPSKRSKSHLVRRLAISRQGSSSSASDFMLNFPSLENSKDSDNVNADLGGLSDSICSSEVSSSPSSGDSVIAEREPPKFNTNNQDKDNFGRNHFDRHDVTREPEHPKKETFDGNNNNTQLSPSHLISNLQYCKRHNKRSSFASLNIFNKSRRNSLKSNDTSWPIAESGTNSTLVTSSQDNSKLKELSSNSISESTSVLKKQKSVLNIACASLNLTNLTLNPSLPPSKLSSPKKNLVILQIVNQTGWPLQLAQWPSENQKRNHVAHHISCFRGSCFDEASIPKVTEILTKRVVQIASIDRSRLAKSKIKPTKPRIGWVYFDLLKPCGYVLHLQCFVKLNGRSGEVMQALIGRFDLDSCRQRPMPSGLIASANISKSSDSYFSDEINCGTGGDIISFVLNLQDVEHEENLVDDTPLKPTFGLATKRLTFYSYVSHPKVILSFRAGRDGRYHEGQLTRKPLVKQEQKAMDNSSKFIKSDHILEGIIGNLSTIICVQHFNFHQPLLYRTASINPLSGLVLEKNKLTPLASTFDTKSIILARADSDLKLSISYGFHDSRMGRRHTMYAYITPDHSSWLGDLINENPDWLNVRFSKLVLPGSHDAGMFTNLHPGFVEMITKMKLDSDIGNFLIDHGISLVHVLTRILKTFNIELDRAICNIANTQKDNIYDQLRLGTRFFDFRPGYCFHDCMKGQRGKIHHQHACVPGYEYVTALEETFLFLAAHAREIAVFELKSDGFIARKTTWRKDFVPFHSMIPTRSALASAIDEARTNVACKIPAVNLIKIGGAADLDRKIGDLIDDGTRLIIINRMGEEPESGWEWMRDDSYDHNLYDTDRSEEIIQALNTTHTRNSIPTKDDIVKESAILPGTIYQLQATPTKSIADDIITSLTYSDASSLLVYTKANVDPHTYAWVRERHFIEPGLVVLLNDFVDSVLTEHAIEKSKIRGGFF
ncbi:hypothetical protein O181_006195 [Austropuccinia psidii MF-1]|uniref:Uncharacterized protein n=1 Tax=Austropuccinia psidii MF-1 TaxID=1389203 RepID=A0A9Q3GGL1_9BASI|nr:hypothetical protein [Austropuccinia psidii MF-1]